VVQLPQDLDLIEEPDLLLAIQVVLLDDLDRPLRFGLFIHAFPNFPESSSAQLAADGIEVSEPGLVLEDEVGLLDLDVFELLYFLLVVGEVLHGVVVYVPVFA
jgi:hypothetical protein